MRKTSFALAGAVSSVLVAGIAADAFGQAVTNSLQNGNWSDSTTWDFGEPTSTAVNPDGLSKAAVINSGHTVTINQPGENTIFIDIGSVDGQTGTLNVEGGDLLIQDADTAAPQIPSIRLGQAVGSTGTLNMTAGTVNITAPGNGTGGFAVGDVLVGDNGTGIMNISGGTFTVSDEVLIGLQNASSGTVTVSGTGTLSTNTADGSAARGIIVGVQSGGVGRLNVQDNATINSRTNLDIGRRRNNENGLRASGIVEMTGGTINVGTPSTLGADFTVGFEGDGQFDLSGNSVVNITDNLVVGIFAATPAGGAVPENRPAAIGVVNQSGGSVNAATMLIGERGQATYNMTGGNMHAREHFLIGQFSTAEQPAIYSQSNGSSATADGAVFFGDPAGSLSGLLVGDSGNGTYNLTDNATFSTPAGSVQVGVFGAGRGTINQSGTSTLTARGLMVGQRGVGTYNMNGGTLNLVGSAATGIGAGEFDNLIVGRSTGTFNHAAGAVNVAENVFLGDFDNSHGIYRASGGTLGVTGNFSVGGALASNAPASPIDTQGQAANADGTLIVSGSGADITIGGNFLANAGDNVRTNATGDSNDSNLIFEFLDSTGTSLIDVGGIADLTGAVVDIDEMGYTFDSDDVFKLINATTVSNDFTIAAEDAARFSVFVAPDAALGGETLYVSLIPEPTSLTLAGLGAMGLLVRRRRAS